MINYLVEIIASLANCLIIFWFLFTYLNKKDNSNVVIRVFALILFFINEQYMSNYYTIQSILFFVIIFATERLLLKGSLRMHVIIPCIIIVTSIIINIGVIQLMAVITECEMNELTRMSGVIRIMILCVTKLALWFVAYLVILHKDKKGKMFNVENSLVIVLYVMISATAIFYSRVIANNNITKVEQIYLFACTFMLIGINIVFNMLISKLHKKSELEIRNFMLNKQLEEQKRMIVETDKLYQDTRRIRHDMKNYLQIISSLIQNNDKDMALDRIEEILDKELKTVEYINTRNKLINAVINEKMSVCKGNSIDFEVQISGDSKCISDMDIAVMLSNLLDNAIEAVMKLESKRKIYLLMYQQDNYYNIVVKNTVTDNIILNNPKMKTTKTNKEEHGIGIYSIKNVVEKYNGYYEVGMEDDKFYTHIII